MQHFEPDGAPGVYDPARAHEIQAFIPGADEHFTLPGDVTKAQAIATAVAVLTLLKGTATDILVFRKIADTTERVAWHDSSRAPVNWRRQCDMARELGLGERHFRRIEARLVRFGVLARATADNGYRGRRSGQGYGANIQCGLSLEPAIANYQAFVDLLAEAKAQEEQRQEVILDVRRAKRRVRLLAEGIGDLETRLWAQGAYEDLCGLLPKGTLRGLDADVLEALHATLLDLEDRIRVALVPLVAEPLPGSDEAATSRQGSTVEAGQCCEPRSEPPCPSQQVSSDEGGQDDAVDKAGGSDMASVENAEKQQGMSAAPDSRVRSHIQPKLKPDESCNALHASKSTPAFAGDINSITSHLNRRDACLEKKHDELSGWVNPAILQKLTPETLRDLASEEAALYLEAVQDWHDALPYLLRELGVNVSAWLEAVDVMGEQIAFIALLVIDRNRFHPVTPIRSPGGALRAFTDRARRGELNLTRAILGIWERDRQGIQPKTAPRPDRMS